MGIIGDITRWGKAAANKVKGIFTQQPTTTAPEKTLNETIQQTQNINAPSLQTGAFANTLNNQLDSAPVIDTQKLTNTGAGSSIGNELGASGNTPDTDTSFFESVPDFIGFGTKLIDRAVNAYTRWDAGNDYEEEVKKNSKSFIKSYNPNTQIITVVQPKDKGAFDARRNLFYSELAKARTNEEYNAAIDSFYNDYKNDGFQAIDTTQGLHKISDDVLSSVAGNKVSRGTYPMSRDEFLDYLEMEEENDGINRDAYNKYKGYMTLGLDEVDLNETEEANKFTQRFSDAAKKNTLDLINSNLASEERGEAIRNADEIVSDQVNRLLTSEMYLKRLRDEAAQTPELQRTRWQRDMIYNYDVVWKQLMDKYASNINDYLLLQLNEGVNDKGQISDALWKFEDGRDLNDILRNGLEDISGIEVAGAGDGFLGLAGETFGKVSAIDIMRRFANEAAYNYRQGKLDQEGSWIKSAWNDFEHWQEPIGEQRSEAGQSVWRLATKLTNTVSSAFEGRWGWNSPASAYWDADFSVGKLIETDDSPNKRTIKKYALQFGEYVPEGVGAVAPDILLTFATSGGSAPSLLRSVGTFSRTIRNFNRVKRLTDSTKLVARGINTTLKGLDRVGEIGRNLGNINSWEKRVFNIADRALSQFAVGQSMDAKLSAFDTEPYSDTSFWLSMGGSLLGDILPEAKDIWGVMRTGLKGGKARTKGTGVWDLVDFINQSDENALLIARQMGKNTAEFSEQDLKNYIKAYAAVTDAAKKVYNELTAEGKAAANSWTKELMYNYVKQAYLPNSRIGKSVRALVENQATNPADIIKYVGNIPGTVSIGPYQSVIKLKQGTMAGVQAKEGWYDVALDVVDGGFGNKVSNGFTFKDIQDISKINGYDDVLKNRDKYFRKVTEKVKDRGGKNTTRTRWVLSEDGLDKFGLETKNLTLASLGIEISGAENVKEIFKEKMKGLEGMKLSNDTIDALAENGGYSEVVSKIENVLC